MAARSEVINILTYKLPKELATQIYNEYHARRRDAIYWVQNFEAYKPLSQDTETIQLLLALSVFYHRVVMNLDGATKFFNTVTKRSSSECVRIGNFEFNNTENAKLSVLVSRYNRLLISYNISPQLLNDLDTKKFLRGVIELKKILSNGENFRNRDIDSSRSEDDQIPF